MLGLCMRYSRNASEAEDIMQEGFVKVFSKIKFFREEGSFEGWIKRIMINTAINYNRKNQKHSFHVDIDEIQETLNLHDGFEQHPTEAQVNPDVLMKMVQNLPDGYKMVFNLYVFEGYKHKEIADMLNISENTSKSQLARARKYILKQLDK